MKNKKLTIGFLSLTLTITWTCWWVLALFSGSTLLSHGSAVFYILYLLGGLAPTYTPFISLKIWGEEEDRLEFKEHLLRFKTGIIWYLAALLLPLIIPTVGFLVQKVMDPQLRFWESLSPWYMIFPTFLFMIIGGGLEELGWRGLLLKELQKKWNMLICVAVITVIWALWHLPLFFIPGVSQYQGDFLIFSVNILFNTILLTWLFQKSRSVVICVFFHAMVNAASEMGLGYWSSNSVGTYINMGVMVVFILGGILFYQLRKGKA